MEQRKSKRSVRLALVLGAAVAGTALVGWGGLAAWQAYTQNSGNAFSVSTLSHTNEANNVTCTSTQSKSTAATNCTYIVDESNLNSTWSGSPGTVTLTNTGQLTSTFNMIMPSGPAEVTAIGSTGNLCPDLTLSVYDAAGNYFYGTSGAPVSLSSPMGSEPLKDAAGSTNWPTYTSGPAGQNTFTFNVKPGDMFDSDNSVPGESCSFDVLFTQAGG
jgi:hypothetical protein